MINLLHIMHDDKSNKASAGTYMTLEGVKSRYIILGNKRTLKFESPYPFEFVPLKEILFKSSVKKLIKGIDVVVFHSINDRYKVQLLAKLPNEVTVFWIGYGGDYYEIIEERESHLFGPKTLALKTTKKQEVWKPKTFKEKVFEWLIYGKRKKINNLYKVDVFAPVIPTEFELVKEKVPDFRAEQLVWNSGSLKKGNLGSDLELRVNGEDKNILLGNSATFANNHADAFELIKKQLPYGWDRLIVPLSYGDTNYRDAIIPIGQETFGDQFSPLLDFMPLDDYSRVAASCPVTLMTHKRQQAAGNIIISLWLGSRVFMDPANPLFGYYKQEGAIIYDQKELGDQPVERLSMEETLQNRKVMEKIYGESAHDQKIQNFLRLAASYKGL